MRKTSIVVAVSALLSASISTSLWAESKPMVSDMDSQSSTMSTSEVNREKARLVSTIQDTMDIQPPKYINKEIITSKGKSIGKIDKLVMSKKDNSVYAISGVGGFFGIGQKELAIPIAKLKLQNDKFVLYSGISEESLKQENEYEKAEFSAFEEKSNSSRY
jgi:hypothetical protein